MVAIGKGGGGLGGGGEGGGGSGGGGDTVYRRRGRVVGGREGG